MSALPAADGEEAPRWAALLGVTAALAVFGAAQGLSSPLFTLLMQRQGYSPALIGLSAAMMPVGLIVSAAFIPRLVERFGGRNLAVACALAGSLCFLAVALLQNWVAWFLVRFVIGLVINPLYVLGEVWALALAPAKRRGRVMGVFNAIMGAGYAAGPLTLALVGATGWPPFMVAIGGFAGCGVILAFVTRGLSGFEPGEGPSGGIVAFAALAPALLVAVGVSAAVQQSTYALMPVFGAHFGLLEATLAALVTALSVGNIVLQIPLGLAAERFGARAMIVACAAATASCALLLPLVIQGGLVWPVLVVMGGVGYGVYTMALVELGNRFKGTTLVAGNAAFALMWGAGGIVGPPSAGALMHGIGPLGLPGVIAVLSAALVLFVVYRSLKRSRLEAGG